MRILVLSALYPPAALGGYERLCRDAVEHFRRNGHEVSVLTSTFGGLHEDTDPNVHRLIPIYWDGGDLVCPPRLRLFRSERENGRVLRRLVRDFAPDVISVWSMGSWSLGLLSVAQASGTPTVYTIIDDWLVYGSWSDCWTVRLAQRPRLVRRIANVLGAPGMPESFDRSSRFCFVSDFTRARALEHAGVDPDQATVVHAGIDTVDFPVLEPGAPKEWQSEVLFVGRLDRDKGADVAIRALAELPEGRLTIVGAGGHPDYRAELHELVAAAGMGDRVVWRQATRNDLAPIYRAADALVFLSMPTEAFGLVPLEAMACGVPVVAAAEGGTKEFLVDGENCLLFDRDDVATLAAALRNLGSDPRLRHRLTVGGRSTAATLTVDRWAHALERIHLDAARLSVPSSR